MISDNEFLILFKKKPEKALEKIMDAYAGLVYTIICDKLSTVCSKEDIEECVSDVFYQLYNQRDTIDLQKGSIKAFLAVIAKRKAIDVYRSQKNKSSKVVPLEDMPYESIAGANTDVEQALEEEESKNEILEIIKALGEPDSEIFIRKYYFGQSTKLIAKALSIKENTVDKKVSRGIVKLKKILGGVF